VDLRDADFLIVSSAGSNYIFSHQGDIDEHVQKEMRERGLEEAYLKTHQGKFNREAMIRALELDGLAPDLVKQFKNDVIPFFPPTESELRDTLNRNLETLIATLSDRDTVGPFDISNKKDYVDMLVRKHWAPDVNVAVVSDDMTKQLQKALQDKLNASGRALGSRAPADCQKLLIELNVE
jgi:hypothetical protein